MMPGTAIAPCTIPGFGRYGFGKPVLHARTAEEAIVEAGLDWEVELAPLYLGNGRSVAEARAVVRADGVCLGVVGPGYRPVQNRTAFSPFDPLVREGLVRFHSAGAFDDGRRVWVVLEMPEQARLRGGDVVAKYVLLVMAHDGTLAVRVTALPMRVICSNGLMAAVASEAGAFVIRHTASAEARLAEATQAVKGILEFYRTFQAEAERLAATPFDDYQMISVVHRLFPSPQEGPAHGKTEATRERVIELFRYGAGHERIGGTAWAAVNAVAEYADHERPIRAGGRSEGEARTYGSWFGRALVLKRQALPFIEEEIGRAA